MNSSEQARAHSAHVLPWTHACPKLDRPASVHVVLSCVSRDTCVRMIAYNHVHEDTLIHRRKLLRGASRDVDGATLSGVSVALGMMHADVHALILLCLQTRTVVDPYVPNQVAFPQGSFTGRQGMSCVDHTCILGDVLGSEYVAQELVGRPVRRN